jgi:hypothetical protein
MTGSSPLGAEASGPMTEKSKLIPGRDEETANASEPDETEHPARKRGLEEAIVNNIRMVRGSFEPQPYPDGFFKRPTVVAFVVLYVISGVAIPLYLLKNHYSEQVALGDANSIFVDDWHKRRVAKAYLCMIPMAMLAIPVF